MRSSFTIVAAAVAALPSGALAQVFHDEVIHGDLSGNGLAPTAYVLAAGTRSLLATTGKGDTEYLALTIPAGAKLSAIHLMSYQGLDPTGFIGVMTGPQFTEPPAAPNAANLLGYSHFGPPLVGTNILDDIGVGFGSIGFTPPLPSGVYTFWIQQLGFAMTYTFDFVIESSCYPDCNGVGGLTIADFGCFQTKFVAGDPYADCNGVGGLTIADFGCFQTAFVAGCP